MPKAQFDERETDARQLLDFRASDCWYSGPEVHAAVLAESAAGTRGRPTCTLANARYSRPRSLGTPI